MKWSSICRAKGFTATPKGHYTNFPIPKGHLNFSQSGPRGPATGPKVKQLDQRVHEQNAQMDLILQDKDAEIAKLRKHLAALKAQTLASPLTEKAR